jgi:hypothetical protein
MKTSSYAPMPWEKLTAVPGDQFIKLNESFGWKISPSGVITPIIHFQNNDYSYPHFSLGKLTWMEERRFSEKVFFLLAHDLNGKAGSISNLVSVWQMDGVETAEMKEDFKLLQGGLSFIHERMRFFEILMEWVSHRDTSHPLELLWAESIPLLQKFFHPPISFNFEIHESLQNNTISAQEFIRQIGYLISLLSDLQESNQPVHLILKAGEQKQIIAEVQQATLYKLVSKFEEIDQDKQNLFLDWFLIHSISGGTIDLSGDKIRLSFPLSLVWAATSPKTMQEALHSLLFSYLHPQHSDHSFENLDDEEEKLIRKLTDALR